ncbi:hypothetical protein ACSFC1_00660 [Pseudothermotoga sp. U03pept]|uniref:hypothetical protein n=1 Tax=Pseudothermotoga sp. U03pept TaxID=3447012 RepID=UPI003F09D36C
MNKRILFFIILLIGVWSVAIYFLFFYGKGTKPTSVSKPQPTQQVTPMRRRLRSEDLSRISMLLQLTTQEIDPFKPYRLHFDEEKLNASILSSIEPLSGYKFAGYLKGEVERAILLVNQNQIQRRALNDMLDGRYLILHVTSFAVAVLDLQTGNLYTIR